jgi:hypothetical protein
MHPPGASASHHATASCLLLSTLSSPLCLPCRRKRGRRQGRGLPPLLIVKCPPPMANDHRATTSSSSDPDDDARVNVIVAKMHAVRSWYYALPVVVAKKTTIGDRQGMLNVIRHALTICSFVIDYPALLEINRKIAVMRGGGILILSKIGLYLFVLCLFYWVIF